MLCVGNTGGDVFLDPQARFATAPPAQTFLASRISAHQTRLRLWFSNALLRAPVAEALLPHSRTRAASPAHPNCLLTVKLCVHMLFYPFCGHYARLGGCAHTFQSCRSSTTRGGQRPAAQHNVFKVCRPKAKTPAHLAVNANRLSVSVAGRTQFRLATLGAVAARIQHLAASSWNQPIPLPSVTADRHRAFALMADQIRHARDRVAAQTDRSASFRSRFTTCFCAAERTGPSSPLSQALTFDTET